MASEACELTQNIDGPYDQTLFLGCSISAFSASVGWNQQTTEITITLVQDDCGVGSIKDSAGNDIVAIGDDGDEYTVPGGQPGAGLSGIVVDGKLYSNPKIYYDTHLEKRHWVKADPGFFIYGDQGDQAASLGSTVYFRVADFEFCGILQSWSESKGTGGNPTYSVKVVDPRAVLEGTELIIGDYAGSVQGTFNLINVYGFMEKFDIRRPDLNKANPLTGLPPDPGKNSHYCPFLDNGPGTPMQIRDRVDETVFGSPAGGFGGSNINANGMQWSRIQEGVELLTSSVPIVRRPNQGATNGQGKDFRAWSAHSRLMYKATPLGDKGKDRVRNKNGGDILSGSNVSPSSSAGQLINWASEGWGLLRPDKKMLQRYPKASQGNSWPDPEWFYFSEYYVDLTELPNTPPWFRLGGTNVNLLDAIGEVCESAGCDYYIELVTIKKSTFEGKTDYEKNKVAKIIKVRTVSRVLQPTDLNQIQTFVNKPENQVIDNTSGRELRNEVCNSFVIGSPVQMIYQANETASERSWSQETEISDGAGNQYTAIFDKFIDDVITPYWGLDPNGNVIIGHTVGPHLALPLSSAGYGEGFELAKIAQMTPTASEMLTSGIGWIHENVVDEDGNNVGLAQVARRPEWIYENTEVTPIENWSSIPWQMPTGEYYIEVDISEINPALRTGPGWNTLKASHPSAYPLGGGTVGATGGVPFKTMLLSLSEMQCAIKGLDSWLSYINASRSPWAFYLDIAPDIDIGALAEAVKDARPPAADGGEDEPRVGGAAGQNQKLANKPTPTGPLANSLGDGIKDAKIVHEFIKRYAQKYGKEFMVRLPFTCGRFDEDTATVITSEEPCDAGWTETPRVLGLPNPSIFLDTFSQQDGTITPFVKFSGQAITNADGSLLNATNVKLEGLSANDYELFVIPQGTVTYQNVPLPGTDGLVTTQSYQVATDDIWYLYVKASLENDLVYVNKYNLYSPRAVLKLPQAIEKIPDYGQTNDLIRGLELGVKWRYVQDYEDALARNAPDKDTLKVAVQRILGRQSVEDFKKEFQQFAGKQSSYFKASLDCLTPLGAAVPLKSNTVVYGPWYVHGPPGRMQVINDDDLNPWGYGGYWNMNIAGGFKVSEGVTFMTEGELGSIKIPGYPTQPLGTELNAAGFELADKSRDGNGNLIQQDRRWYLHRFQETGYIHEPYDWNTHTFGKETLYYDLANHIEEPGPSASTLPAQLAGSRKRLLDLDVLRVYERLRKPASGADGPPITSVNVEVGPGGITTNYSMRTYSPKFGTFTKGNADRLKQTAALSNKLQKQTRKFFERSVRVGVQGADIAYKDVRTPDASDSAISRTSPHGVMVGEMFHADSTKKTMAAPVGAGNYRNTSVLSHTYKELQADFANVRDRAGNLIYNTYERTAVMSWDGLLRPVSMSGAGRLPQYYNTNIKRPYNKTNETTYFRWSASTGEGGGAYDNFFAEWRSTGESGERQQPWTKPSVEILTSLESRIPYGGISEPDGSQNHQWWLNNPRIGYEQSGASPLKNGVPEFGKASGLGGTGVYPDVETRPPLGHQGFPNNSISPAPPVHEWQSPVISLSYLNPFTNETHSSVNPTGINIKNWIGTGTKLVPGGLMKQYDWSAMHSPIGLFPVGTGCGGSSPCMGIRGSGDGNDVFVTAHGTLLPKTDLQKPNADWKWGAKNEGYGAYADDVRVLGLRGPLVIHGWGYDIQGKPIPNAADSEVSASGGDFKLENLKDTFYPDWLKKPHTWPVAPIDLRFDRVRGVWTAPQNFGLVKAKMIEHARPDMPARATLMSVTGDGPVDPATNNIQGTGYTYYDASGSGISAPTITLANNTPQELPVGATITAYYDTQTSEYHPLGHVPRWPRDDIAARCVRGGTDYRTIHFSKPYNYPGKGAMVGMPDHPYPGGAAASVSGWGDGTGVYAPLGSTGLGWLGKGVTDAGLAVGRLGDPFPGIDENGMYISLPNSMSGVSPTGHGGRIVYDSLGTNGIFIAPTGAGYPATDDGIKQAVRNSTAHEERGVAKWVPVVTDVQCCSDGSLHVCFLELQFDAHGHLVDVVDTPTDPVLWSGGQGHGDNYGLGHTGNDVYSPARYAPSCYGTCPTGSDMSTCVGSMS